MRIGLNLLYLIPNKVGGTETLARELVRGLAKLDKKNAYYIFCNNENYPTFSDTSRIRRILIPINARNRALRLMVEQTVLPFVAQKYQLDVIHSLGYITPLACRCRKIVGIHDLNWYYHPEDFGLIERNVLRLLVTLSAKMSDKIIALSQASKKSIVKVLKVKKDKVEVLYGCTPKLATPGPRKSLVKFGIDKKYLFTVLAAYPHKNLIGALRAFRILIEKGHDILLVVAGLGGRASDLTSTYIKQAKIGDRVKILGYVESKDLSTLYKYCDVYIFPSLYEGFGIPILEAFSFGKPVVSSGSFSLKEVVGNAGIVTDASKPKIFAHDIERVLKNKTLRAKISLLGNKRTLLFSSSRMAKKAVHIYNKTIHDT